MNDFRSELRRYRVSEVISVQGGLRLAEEEYPGMVEWTIVEEMEGPVESERRYMLRLGRDAYRRAGGTDNLRFCDVDITGEV